MYPRCLNLLNTCIRVGLNIDIFHNCWHILCSVSLLKKLTIKQTPIYLNRSKIHQLMLNQWFSQFYTHIYMTNLKGKKILITWPIQAQLFLLEWILRNAWTFRWSLGGQSRPLVGPKLGVQKWLSQNRWSRPMMKFLFFIHQTITLNTESKK